MIIGITGSICSGKTIVAKIFSRHRFNRIDADEISHKLMKNNKQIKKILIKNFGNNILDKNKDIDRNKLGDIVFNDNAKLKKLNSIMHPEIIKKTKNKIKKIKNKCGKSAKIIIDAPLLLETEAKKPVDKIVVVKCSKKNILRRNKRFTRQQIERILNTQMPLKEKLRHSDFVIDNNKTIKETEKQVMSIIQKLNKK